MPWLGDIEKNGMRLLEFSAYSLATRLRSRSMTILAIDRRRRPGPRALFEGGVMQARWVSSLARTLVVCACTAALATAGAHATFLRSTDDKDQSDRAERDKGPCSNGPTIPGAVPLDTLKSCGGPTQIEPADSAAKFVQLGPVIVQESQ